MPARRERISPWWAVVAVPVLAAATTWLGVRLFHFAQARAAERQTRAAVARPDGGLELRLERTAVGDMKVQWNRRAQSIQTAVGGRLRIREGSKDRDLDIDLDQLRSGNLLYLAGTGDVIFRLEVSDAAGRVTSESVLLIGGMTVPAPRAPVQPRAAGQPAPVQRMAERSAPAAPAQPLMPLEVPAAQTAVALPSPEPAVATPQLAPPPVTGRPAAPATVAVVNAPAAARQPVPVPQAPVQAPPPQQAPPQPAPAQQARPAPPTPPPPDEVQPARATRQFRPTVPSNVRSMLTKETLVTVLVVVDEQGKVASAAAQGATGVVGQMLAGIAVDAARTWRFEPARRNGKPVSSNVSLVFRFSK